ncbi:MAG: BNR-4 repeat-containing protein [Gammaproteobacteria bacterium]|nr:BNR-4 repeat-containing protein [Gammaproteobacteria bacterium]
MRQLSIFKFFFLFLLFFSLKSFAVGTIVNQNEETNLGAIATGFEPSEPYTQVWHYKDSTYTVYVDSNYRAWVSQTKNGVTTKAPVDAGTDYLVQADGHHRFSLGVDKNGYIHVTGDMHHYSTFSDKVITPYPTRYQHQIILYWRSNLPEDVTGGFTFKGDNTATAINGGGWMQGRFFADNNGELFYTSQTHAFEALDNSDQNALGLYRYHADTQTWTTIGATVPITDRPYENHIAPVFYWEKAGLGTGEWFQNYQGRFFFDKDNHMHFVASGWTDDNTNGANRIVYAMSPDDGVTWFRANGTQIVGFPLRGIDGLPNTADIVADAGTTGPYFAPTSGIGVDRNGKPAISNSGIWRAWDGSQWSVGTTLNFKTVSPPGLAYRLPNQDLFLTINGVPKIGYTSSFDSTPITYDVLGYNSFGNIDDYTVKTIGDVYGVAIRQDNNSLALLKLTLANAALPSDWSYQYLTGTPVSEYQGDAGYLNGLFDMTSYGGGLDDVDSFSYIYKKMSGDGSITAKVTAINDNVKAGLMMRESLSLGSKYAGMFLTAKPGIQQAEFMYRATDSNWPINSYIANIPSTYWIKLVRAGDIFTTYLSTDGNSWTASGSGTVVMGSDIYVGMAVTGENHYWYPGVGKFENVITPSACVRANPALTVAPVSQQGQAGSTLSYKVTIKNNDGLSCAPATYNLTQLIPAGLTGTLDKTSVTIAPGVSSDANLNVTSAATTTAGTYNVKVSATDAVSSSLTGSVTAADVVTAACVQNNTTVTLNPSTQTTSGLNPVSYTATITNNDSTACAARTFDFVSSINTTNINLVNTPTSLTLNPKQSGTAQVTATPLTGLSGGTYTLTAAVQGGGATASLVYQAAQVLTLQVTSDKSVYTRTQAGSYATLTAKTSINGSPVGSVPLVGTLIYPNGSTTKIPTDSGAGTRLFYYQINMKTNVGTYTFKVDATYKNKVYSNSVSFNVK